MASQAEAISGGQGSAARGTGQALALATLCTLLFLTFLDNTVVSVALGDVQVSLKAGVTDLQWVVGAYALTFAPMALASGSLAKSLMAPENELPFCSSLTRSAVGVLALKNFSQLAEISAAAPAGVLELLDAVALADAAVETGAEAGLDEEEAVADDPELLQAVAVSASARPRAGSRVMRRATRVNRMDTPP